MHEWTKRASFRKILTSPLCTLRQVPCPLSVKGPLCVCFQRFEIQTHINLVAIITGLCRSSSSWPKGQIVEVSVIKGGVLQEGRLLKVREWECSVITS